MAQTGEIVSWSDVVNLYSKLNTARKKFNFPTVSTPSGQGTAVITGNISTLNNFLGEMKSNSFLSGISLKNNNPTRGTLLYPLYLNDVEKDINTIQAADAFGNSSFGDSSFSFGNSSFGNSSFCRFSNSGFGNSSFGNSGFGNSSFGNSSFGLSGGGDISYGSGRFVWG